MINLVRIFFTIILLGVVVACSSSSHVSNSSFIQKRKYQSGFHIASRSKNTSNLTRNSTLKNEVCLSKRDTTPDFNGLVSSEAEGMYSVISTKMDNPVEDIASINHNEPFSMNHSNVTKENVSKRYQSKQTYIKQDTRSSEKSIKKNVLKRLSSASKKSSKSVDIDAYMLLLIILACIIPPLAVLLYTDIDWKKVAISLILCLFFYFPAIIYALLVLFDVL